MLRTHFEDFKLIQKTENRCTSIYLLYSEKQTAFYHTGGGRAPCISRNFNLSFKTSTAKTTRETFPMQTNKSAMSSADKTTLEALILLTALPRNSKVKPTM